MPSSTPSTIDAYRCLSPPPPPVLAIAASNIPSRSSLRWRSSSAELQRIRKSANRHQTSPSGAPSLRLEASSFPLKAASSGGAFPTTIGSLLHTDHPLCSAPRHIRSFVSFSSTASEGRSMFSSSAVIGKNDLLIVGPGVLGRIVAEKWKEMHKDCQTFGQSATTNHHVELKEQGIIPLLRGSQIGKFPYVIFCAPPYGNANYSDEIRSAASSWSGEGSFVFTSSSAVYDCNDNGICDEDTAIVPIGRSPRTDLLLKAEKEALDAGGCVVRLAGLYKLDRGAHAYWLEKGLVESRPDHILNLIHYEDAASLCIAILKKQLRSRIFLGCDNYPLSRQELMDCVDKSGKFGKKFQGFTGTSDPLGKRLDNSKTHAEIGWQPMYPSFPQFLDLQQ